MSSENTVATAEAPPAWMQSVMDQFERRLADRITSVQNELRGEIDDRITAAKEELRDEISGLRNEIDEVRRLAVLAHIKAARRDNGYFNAENQLDQVPFPDGVFPWGETVAGPGGIDVKLPALSSLQAVRDLSPRETYGYFKGYYPQEDIPEDLYDQKTKVMAYLGRCDIS